jgi:hypothetical protein
MDQKPQRSPSDSPKRLAEDIDDEKRSEGYGESRTLNNDSPI